MENAHLRMGKLKFVRQTRDTITEVSLHLDRLVAEKPAEPRSAVQIWANDLSTSTSSPILAGDRIYVVSEKGDLCCVDVNDGRVLWKSTNVGLDGVIAHDVSTGVVHGSGEWDPPGGWRPFVLSLATGEAISA